MASRLRITGVGLIIVGIVALIAAGYAYMQVQAGQDALNGFSAAQNVTLSYNEDGELIDRGSPRRQPPSWPSWRTPGSGRSARVT